MGLTWCPPGCCQPQMGPMLAPWTLLVRYLWQTFYKLAGFYEFNTWPSFYDGVVMMQVILHWKWCKDHPLIASFMGLTWAHLGVTTPRWAPHWPHERGYLGHDDIIIRIWFIVTRPLLWEFLVFFDVCLHKQFNKQSYCQWFEMLWHSWDVILLTRWQLTFYKNIW